MLHSNYLKGVCEPEDLIPQIKHSEPGDAGTYICQVNTEPKTAQRIHLKVTGGLKFVMFILFIFEDSDSQIKELMRQMILKN